MKVPRDESVASHIGPESCAGIREGSGEALTGESIGQPLSRERSFDPGADAVPMVEGNTAGRAIRERPVDPAWSKTLACADAPCTGTGRSRARPLGQTPAGPRRGGEEP